MEKTAYEQGIVDAYASLGMDKEAIWGKAVQGIAKGLGAAGKFFGTKGRGLTRATLKPGGGTGALGKMRRFGGDKLQAMGRSFEGAGKGFAANPLQTLGGGAKNFGTGVLTLQGKGIGGALGKGVGTAGMAGMFLGGGSPTPAPQQQAIRPYYGGY